MDRYDDIWAGLFLKRAADQMGDVVTYGRPLVRHDRNQHDLLRDLSLELWGMIINDRLFPAIMEMQLTERTYLGLYREMSENLRRVKLHDHPDVRSYITRLAQAMMIWADTYEVLVG